MRATNLLPPIKPSPRKSTVATTQEKRERIDRLCEQTTPQPAPVVAETPAEPTKPPKPIPISPQWEQQRARMSLVPTALRVHLFRCLALEGFGLDRDAIDLTFLDMGRRRELAPMRAKLWFRMRTTELPTGGFLSYPEIAMACGMSAHSTIVEAVHRLQAAERGKDARGGMEAQA